VEKSLLNGTVKDWFISDSAAEITPVFPLPRMAAALKDNSYVVPELKPKPL